MTRSCILHVPMILIALPAAGLGQTRDVRLDKDFTPQPGKVQSVVYKAVKDAELKMEIHFPADWKKGDRRAGIVFFFGGGWTNGKLSQFEPQATYLAARGMVAARADYRVKSRHDVTPLECVADARSAVRWLRIHADALGIDTSRIVAAGGSAGGHIAACTAYVGKDVLITGQANALVLFNPVLKFEGVPELTKRLADPGDARILSPTLHVAKGGRPAILFYGTEDKLLAQGEEYIARAKEKGSRAEIMLADGVGHGFFNKTPWLERTLLRADEFLVSLGYLKAK